MNRRYSLSHLNELYKADRTYAKYAPLAVMIKRLVHDIRQNTHYEKKRARGNYVQSRNHHAKKAVARPIQLSQHDEMSNVIKHLNKITDRTYDKLSGEILDVLLRNTNDFVHDFFDRFFVNLNASIIDVYVRIYGRVAERVDVAGVVDSRNSKLLDDLQALETVPPTQYDEFCNQCKTNERRGCYIKFLCALTYKGVFDNERAFAFVTRLHGILTAHLSMEGREACVNECAVCLQILFLNSGVMRIDSVSSDVYPDLVRLSSQKAGDHPSLTNKALFKFKDIKEKYSKP